MTTETRWIKFLEEEHRISREVWKKHGLHFDEEFLYIPYFSKSGRLLYNKKRREPLYNGRGKYLYASGVNSHLWPYHDLSNHKEWILTEGELDQLSAESFGFPAVTAGGIHNFRRHFTDFFKGKNVHICFDCDESGKKGAEELTQIFLDAKIDVDVIDLPEMENGKDIGDFFRLGHTKDEFNTLIKRARKPIKQENETSDTKPRRELISTLLTFGEVENKVLAYLPSSKIGLRIVLAIAASCIHSNQVMLWMLLVGVPSSGKTDLVRLIKDAEVTYYLDNLTQNAFISGERSTKSYKTHDLLPLIHRKCLIIKDWTPIFSLDEKMTKKLLGDLVGIYDKEFTKFSSRRGNVSYLSEFSQLGCITPATLNQHTRYMSTIGARFLCYTMPSITEEEGEQSFSIIFSDQDRSVIEKEARLYTSSYLHQLTQTQFNVKQFNSYTKKYLQIAAELMASCRGIVILQTATFKNEVGEEIKYYEILDVQVEEPWRAVQQLIHLAKYLAFIVGKNEVGIEELVIIKEVVISSMPADRSQALRLMKSRDGEITAKELADLSEKSSKTSKRLLEELSALKVLEKIIGSGSIATDYKFKDKFKSFILLDPAEFMTTYSCETETPDGQVSLLNVKSEVVVNSNNGQLKPCYSCQSKKFWKATFGKILCATCHPPNSEKEVIAWIEL